MTAQSIKSAWNFFSPVFLLQFNNYLVPCSLSLPFSSAKFSFSDPQSLNNYCHDSSPTCSHLLSLKVQLSLPSSVWGSKRGAGWGESFDCEVLGVSLQLHRKSRWRIESSPSSTIPMSTRRCGSLIYFFFFFLLNPWKIIFLLGAKLLCKI